MIALLMSVVLSGAPADRQALLDNPPLIANPYHCREVAERVRDGRDAVARKLGQLPPAHAEFALMRKVEGCMVPVPMRFQRPALRSSPNP
jgi:hypothetical protein